MRKLPLVLLAFLFVIGFASSRAAEPAPDGPGPARFSYRQGVLITHWLGAIAPVYLGQSDVPHTYAAAWFDDEDIAWIAAQGFDHVQILVDAQAWMPVGDALPQAKLAPFEHVLRVANGAGLGVVLILADDPWAEPAPDPTSSAHLAATTTLWRGVSRHFATEGEGLRFHLGETEPAADSAPARRFMRLIRAIREHGPTRFVYVIVPVHEVADEPRAGAPSSAVRAFDIDALGIDRFDRHVGVSLGYWEPQAFTMQLPGQGLAVPFPGRIPDFATITLAPRDDDYAERVREQSGRELTVADLERDFDAIAAWRQRWKTPREIYLYRFGVVGGNAPDDTRRYLRAFTRAAAARDLRWSIYDYESGRAVRGRDGRPTPQLEGLGLRSPN